MNYNEIYEKTVYAFEHDEVLELLMGEKDYSYQAPMVPVSIPTHYDDVLNNGIYQMYKKCDAQEREKIVASLESALEKMINSENAIYVWWAFAIIFGQKLNEIKYKKSPFILSEQVLDKIKPCLFYHKDALINTKMYGGQGYSNGLWGDVLRYNSLFNKYCNRDLLG